jgi:putative DNA primase/helicase
MPRGPVTFGDVRPDIVEEHAKSTVSGNGQAGQARLAEQQSRVTTLQSKPALHYKMRGIQWVWKNRFAVGKIGFIGGLPDEGKGLITADIIARITTGNEWPCGEGTAPLGNVILLSAEDDVEDTIVPRLKAGGANLDRVHIIESAQKYNLRTRKFHSTMFNLTEDLPALQRKIDEIGDVVQVIIDPVTSYVGFGKINSSSTTDIRGILAPLITLAMTEQVSVLGIMHFNKKADITNAMLRIADSLAYVAAARHVYVVGVCRGARS